MAKTRPRNSEDLKKRAARWRSRAGSLPEKQDSSTTTSGVPVEPLYTPIDIADTDYLNDLGFPGEYPYTRGVHNTGYRGKLWTMRMFAGFGCAEETNARYKYLLEHGETGLSVAFDFPTLNGYDTDDTEAKGEFGKCGVGVSSLADMEILFAGIPVDKISTSMTINGPAAVIWAMYLANAQKRGIALEKLGGTIQNDILKEYMAQNAFIFPPKPSMRLIVDTFEFGMKQVPRWNTISISGYHIREAGATAIQELAFTLADGLAYVQAGIDRGLKVDDFAPRLSFFFNCHNDFFEEIAKFRAARRIWAREMKERFNGGERSQWLRFHTQTAGCSLSAQQPENNIARVTLQALAAVLGGTQSLHTNSMDEALALPTEKAAQIALRTQQIIAYETGVADTIDPLAGSYVIEHLTDEIVQRAEAYLQKIDEIGGALKAIETGFISAEIDTAAYEYQRAIENGQRVLVGVNQFAVAEEINPHTLKVNPAIEAAQCEKLARLRAERDNAKVAELRSRLAAAAHSSDNLMPLMIECVASEVTLGEIAHTLRGVFGEYRSPVML